MGCGMSKYDPEDSVLFCKFNARQNNLHPIDQNACSDNKADHHCQNSITSPAKENERELETKELETEKEPRKKVSTAKAVPEEEGLHHEEIEVSKQNHEEEEEENELFNEREDCITAPASPSLRDCIIGPGSPSFRLYCRDSDSKGSSKNDGFQNQSSQEKEKRKKITKEYLTQVPTSRSKIKFFNVSCLMMVANQRQRH
ncbi:uncharacterized protein LOC136063602 [Quercus suber]|uniref:uncharacterized protein LOC136063602 n=1 Tax=Quercus suber TaxID=58331 RepID=UPI0032DE36F5